MLILVLVCHAMLCSFPGFILGYFWDLGKKKKWIFLALVIILSMILNFKKFGSLLDFVYGFLMDFVGSYFGLFLLVSFKNIARKAGICKICDRFRRKGEKANYN